MIFLKLFLYYAIYSSLVLFYGVGVVRVTQLPFHDSLEVNYLIKIFCSILISTVLTWLCAMYLLLPLKLVELYPIIAFLIYICVNTFFEALIRITTGKSSAEFAISFLIILLSVNESTSILESMVICCASICSFLFLIPVVYAIGQKIYVKKENILLNTSLLFLSLVVVILLLSVFDVSWLNLVLRR
ncbi:MAG: hypothetical protein MJ176_06280 [Treponema sp.]|nr:hypothetical protein [Treponema sp.]